MDYDLVVKDATLLDPSSGLYEKKDVAISDGKIEDISASISGSNSKRVVDASGSIVTAGFVDIHAHVANRIVGLCIDPDANCLMKGTTTVADAGSCGELNFEPFETYVIKKSGIRILGFLNIESLGMVEFVDIPNQKWAKLLNSPESSRMFANVENTVAMIRKNRRTIVGIKWAHHTLDLLRLARRAADRVPCIVMAESRLLPDSLRYLKKGDVATHIFHFAKHQITKKHHGITLDKKVIHPEVFDAKRRGVVFDIGHGKGSFSWEVARLALKEGLEPDTISTDLWSGNVAGPVYDLPTTMEKLLHLGMSLEGVVRAVTSRPASVLGKDDEFGALKPGLQADLVLFKIQRKKKILTDSYGKSERTNEVIVPKLVIKGGSVV
jgi:dihydroorotase